MAVAATPSVLAFWACKRTQNWKNAPAKNSAPSDTDLELLPFDLELPSLSELLLYALNASRSREAALAIEGPQHKPGSDGSSLAMLGVPRGSKRGSAGSSPSLGSSGSPGAPKGEILTDKPHLAVKQEDGELEFLPVTNYNWYSDNKIVDLEQHIADIQKRRLRLANEAEVVASWLSEAEATHLERFPVTRKMQKDEMLKLDSANVESSVFVQILGHLHAEVLKEVHDCDLMIVSITHYCDFAHYTND